MRLLGVDVGTTSLKAVLFDENGKPLSSVCVDYTLHASGERVELEAETYWRIFRQALDQVCRTGFRTRSQSTRNAKR